MTAIKPFLWFDTGQARKAADFYASIFPDSHVRSAWNAGADFHAGEAGDEIIVEFTVVGLDVVGMNGGPGHPQTDAFSFQVHTETQEETDRYWDAIVGNGGAENACGWCKDRWGVSWQITPRQLMEAMSSPDREAAGRAMQAMMTMRKIDIAAIERAFAGE